MKKYITLSAASLLLMTSVACFASNVHEETWSKKTILERNHHKTVIDRVCHGTKADRTCKTTINKTKI